LFPSSKSIRVALHAATMVCYGAVLMYIVVSILFLDVTVF